MMSRRTLARCAAILLLAASAGGCSLLPKLKGKDKDAYTGAGTRIPVLGLNAQLEPAAALQGVEFSLGVPQARAEWPTPGGSPENSVDHAAAGQSFSIAWRRKVGDGVSRDHHVTATPLVAGNRIYTMDGGARVSARDASTGGELWSVDLAPRSGRDQKTYGGGIAFADNTVYVASGYRFVTALDAGSGAVKWRTAMSSPIHTAPNVAEGRVFAVDIEDQLYAFDVKDGSVIWNYQALSESAKVRAASTPAISGDVVVAPFASGELVALRTANGTALWNDTLSLTSRNNALSEIRDIAGRPVIYRGDVFAGSHSGVVAAISLRDGQRRWELPITSITSPLPTGDVVYFTDQIGRVFCVSRESGLVYWSVDLNAGVKKPKNRAVFSGPLLASGRLIVVSSKGVAIALDPKTGARTGSLKLGSGAFLSPIAAGGMVYVMTQNAELVAIR